jgi:hypothetical protein
VCRANGKTPPRVAATNGKTPPGVAATNGIPHPLVAATNGIRVAEVSDLSALLAALRDELTGLRIRVEVAEAAARERDRVIAAKDEALGSLRTILAAGRVAPPMLTESATPVPNVAPPATTPNPALSGLGRSEDHAEPKPTRAGPEGPEVGTAPAKATPEALVAQPGLAPVGREPPKPQKRRAAASLPTTLDSLLANKPAEPEEAPRPWWRRAPRPEPREAADKGE